MHPHLFPTIFPFFLIITFVLIHVPTSLCADDEQYLTCGRSFECANIPNINYPFWGQDRPDYCGHPEFELNCEGDAPEITIATLKYRVLVIENTTQTLTVARADYWDTICPQYLVNATFDISLFNYISTTQDLKLYYGCPPLPPSIMVSGQFPCTINETAVTGYYETKNATEIAATLGISLGTCNSSVIVPAFQSAVQTIESNPTQANILEALKGGFGLEWTVNNTLCDGCAGSGGQCGYNLDSRKFTCYCTGGPSSSKCGNNKSGVSLTVGIAIGGAGIVGLFLGFLFFYCRQRKKRLVAQSKSKDLPTPPSSKGLTTPTTNSFQSIPSYPFTKSDLEKGSTYFGVQVFSYTELEEATDNFDPSRELGEGGFGTVYYGNLRDGRVVAVKRLYENNFKRVEQFMNEVEILTRLRHKNLVMLYGCTSKRSRELLLVYEYIPNGTVADHLHGKKSNSGLLTWPVRLSIAIETADALAYLHVSDIIHRDVKTNNILLDNDFRVKVADFGLSRLFPTDCTHVSTAPQGTPGYVDPEYYQCYQLTDKSDVYSFGVVLMELVSSKEAVDTNRHRHDINLANMAINKIQNHTLHELVDPCLGFETDDPRRRMITAMAELAFRCLQQERDMRPSMEEVLEVLRGIEKEDFNAQKAEVVDIRADDIGLLKSLPPPISPDSLVSSDKWVPYTF